MLTVTHFKKALLSLLGTLLFTVQLTGNEIEFDSDELKSYEFYVTANQLVINSEGIFLNCKDFGLIQANHLSYIGSGIFLVKGFIECPQHGQYCPSCGGCHPNNRCQYRCKCPPRRQVNQKLADKN